jgi:hypothetical protein
MGCLVGMWKSEGVQVSTRVEKMPALAKSA